MCILDIATRKIAMAQTLDPRLIVVLPNHQCHTLVSDCFSFVTIS